MYASFYGIISKTDFSLSQIRIKRFWQKFKGDRRSKMYPFLWHNFKNKVFPFPDPYKKILAKV